MKKIKVLRGKNRYTIIAGSGCLELFPRIVAEQGLHGNILYVVDENVYKLHSASIKEISGSVGGKNNIYIMPSGEKYKSTEQYQDILYTLINNNFGRDSLIAAIGGGVTGDIAGFAASTYMRGIQVVHIPTTLLAAVDSSIGGKTGINFSDRKNIVGTFYQPKFVLTDYSFFNSLPVEEIISGAGEIIKYAFLGDRLFYNEVNDLIASVISLDNKSLNKIIPACAEIKAAVVTADEKESGIRKILNLGHTFAHAYESYYNFNIKHGCAVIAGIISSLFLSYKKGIINRTSLDYFLKLPLKIKFPVSGTPDTEAISRIMLSDKKNKEGKIKFILVNNIGEIMIDAEADGDQIRYSVQKTFELLNSNLIT
jgi:3-dehydroquinate synthase